MEKRPSRWPLRIVLLSLLAGAISLLVTAIDMVVADEMESAAMPQITVGQRRLRERRRVEIDVRLRAADAVEQTSTEPTSGAALVYDTEKRRRVLRGEELLDTSARVLLLREIAAVPDASDVTDLLAFREGLEPGADVRLAYTAAAVGTVRAWARSGPERAPILEDFEQTEPGKLAYTAVETAYGEALRATDARVEKSHHGVAAARSSPDESSPWKTVRLAILQLRDVAPEIDDRPAFRHQRAQILQSVERSLREAMDGAVAARNRSAVEHDPEMWRVAGLLGNADTADIAIRWVAHTPRDAAATGDRDAFASVARSAVEVVARLGTPEQRLHVTRLLARRSIVGAGPTGGEQMPDPHAALQTASGLPDPITTVEPDEATYLR